MKLRIPSKHVCAAMICALAVLSGTAWAAGPNTGLGEGRNFDSRIEYNRDFVAAKSEARNLALEALRAKVPNLGVTFDEKMGVTRSLMNYSGFLTGPDKSGADAMDIALAYVRSNLQALGLTPNDIADFEVTDRVDNPITGSTHIYLRQLYRGLPVYNGQLQINLDAEGRILGVNNAFVPRIAAAVRGIRPALAAGEAVGAAALHLGIERGVPAELGALNDVVQTTTLAGEGISREDVTARLVLLPIRDGEVRLGWNFQIQTLDDQHYFDFTVDADTGAVVTRFDWTNSGTYRVYDEPDESPLHGSQTRTLVSNPEDATASPNGWFAGGTMAGNNVHACPDANGNNVCDSDPQCAGTTCDFAINLNNAPSTYIPAATTNLFYWNNHIHDVQYKYGFTESAGNFQENNFGRGGAGSDSVNADAQDGSGNCNANFSTPTDGGNPRMQMFTCTNANPARDGDLDNGVIVHEYGHGISIRQVGGPGNSSCLNNSQQPGEGWSDWHGLVYTAEPGDAGTDSRGIGTYLFGQAPNGPGIRDLPYSTNNAINNWTYASIAGASIPHGIGSRWAQGIWEVYWALVADHGFSSGAQLLNPGAGGVWTGSQRALLYVNEGLQNTACSPTFINARDGIIQAVTSNFGGEDLCTVWTAFAAFGLGSDASTGGSNSTTATNGFNIPAGVCDAPPPPPPSCSNVLHSADFEGGGADGWTNDPASTCTTGAFVAATPTLVVDTGVTTQVGGAAGGTGAWFTATNSSAGVNDVDGGTCDTRSPTVTAGAGDVTVTFDYFHGQRDAGDDAADGFVVDVLNGSGGVVTTIVNIGDVTRNAAWTPASATFSVAGDTNLRLRVRATDGAATGDLVEGGIDNVQICGNPPGGPPPGGGCTVDDDFEAGAAGWFNDGASTCTTGTYVLGNPTNPGGGVQIVGSHSGVNSIFTATNSSAGVNDVDGGNCILGSPTWSVAASSTLSVWYWHGQRDNADDPAGDFFRLEYSTNGGASWNTLASRGDAPSTPVWTNATAQIAAGSNVALRVQCSDGAGPGDLVECGIDDVSICDN